MTFATPIMTDEEIVKLVILKNRAGAEALYDRYATAIFLAIIRIIPQKDKAEDILKQTYIKVWNSFDNFESKNGKLLAWMRSIACSLANECVQNMHEPQNKKSQA